MSSFQAALFVFQLEALEDPVPAVEAIVSRCSKEQVWEKEFMPLELLLSGTF